MNNIKIVTFPKYDCLHIRQPQGSYKVTNPLKVYGIFVELTVQLSFLKKKEWNATKFEKMNIH